MDVYATRGNVVTLVGRYWCGGMGMVVGGMVCLMVEFWLDRARENYFVDKGGFLVRCCE